VSANQKSKGVLMQSSAKLGGPAANGDTVLIPVKLCNLPPFHAVASKLLSLSEDGGSNLREVASIVGGDPALAAEILFLANSSLFGFPARIESLRHAVAVLGFDSVKRLAMTVVIRALARGAGPFVRSCWCHSVACAVIAEKIAPAFGCNGDQAYTAGLMHDVGRLGFLRTYPAEIGPVLAGEYTDADQVMAAERSVMNASHEEAGAWLIEYWALPTAFSEICAHHHDPVQESDSHILQVVKTACRLADATGYAPVRYAPRPRYADVLQSTVPHVPAKSFPSEPEIQDEVEARLVAFDSDLKH
jgi:putative nucleotidyltransferase with HDIG domain